MTARDRHRTPTGQSGQASSEYAGILAVVAIVLVALFASGLAPTVADAASNAVCAILGKGCDAGAGAGGEGAVRRRRCR